MSDARQNATTVADNIRARRKALGLTQAQAGERIDMPQSQWAESESGQNSPTLTTLSRIATALGCDVRDLV